MAGTVKRRKGALRKEISAIMEEVSLLDNKVTEFKTLKRENQMLLLRLKNLRTAFYAVVTRLNKPPDRKAAFLQYKILDRDFEAYRERKLEEKRRQAIKDGELGE